MIGWLRSDRLHAVTVYKPLPAFNDASMKSMASTERSSIECVTDLWICIKASMSGRIAIKPASRALFNPSIGATRAKGIEKCRSSSDI